KYRGPGRKWFRAAQSGWQPELRTSHQNKTVFGVRGSRAKEETRTWQERRTGLENRGGTGRARAFQDQLRGSRQQNTVQDQSIGTFSARRKIHQRPEPACQDHSSNENQQQRTAEIDRLRGRQSGARRVPRQRP